MNNLAPALIIDPSSGIFIGDLFGFILAVPVSLFLAFWLSAVKSRGTVVLGAFAGALLGFLVVLGWVGTLIYDTNLPNADGGSTFFGSLIICSVGGVVGGIFLDLILARRNSADYRRRSSGE